MGAGEWGRPENMVENSARLPQGWEGFSDTYRAYTIRRSDHKKNKDIL